MKHIEIGTLISHYRIVRRLGVGGMGAVFLAQDLTLDRPVAIKFLTAPDDERSRRRLLHEAQAVAALEHEGIAAVYEVGEDPVGGDFIVMQYVEGETLAARLHRGRLPLDEALAIGERIAEALVVAHKRGVIHRDLKPQNVIISPAGTPKLLDFGLARRTIAPATAADRETMSESIASHRIVGTPSYMAPEQIRSQRVDARSDVFALGCVLYECLTGRRAFSGSTSADIFGQVLHVEPPTASSIVPELGPAYDALCARLLKKSASERFQSAEEVLGAIHALTDTAKLASSHSASHASHTLPITGIWTALSPRARWTTMLATALLVITAAAAWQWSRGTSLPEPPADAKRYYEMGVEALRDGTYARARSSFTEALTLFDSYVQAYYGLAQAHMELDDERSATKALLRVNQLVPDRTRLGLDDQLRHTAVDASVQRTHSVAIAAYRTLTQRYPNESGAWLDLGRANEAAELRREARADYEKALALDAQSPAAHVRLGMVLVQEGKKNEAIPFFDEAIRLYQVSGNLEGEAEALLRKGIAFNNTGDLDAATAALQEVVRLAGDRYLSQRVRAQFELARVAAQRGRPEDAVALTEALVQETTDAGLHTIAANGLVDFANLFLQSDRARVDAELTRAMQMAADHGATRTEMRAQLQRVFLRSRGGKPEEAIALAAAPLAFYADGRYPMLEAVAKTVVSRAKEALGAFDEAIGLSTEVLKYADEMQDEALASDVLQNLAGQFTSTGRLPEALAALERSADIYRRKGQVPALGSTLVRQAELLVTLGRGKEAEVPVAEAEAGITAKLDTDPRRPRRIARLRALLAATEGRFDDVARHAAEAAMPAATPAGTAADSVALSARAFAEYALAKLGRSRTPPAALVKWLDGVTSATLKRELSYWVAQTLRAKGQDAMADEAAKAAWEAPDSQLNPELRWRLAALARVTILPRSAEDDVQKLKGLWPGYDATAYFSRADLKPLLGNTGQ